MKKGVDWDYSCNKLQKAYDLAISSNDDFSFYVNLVNYIFLFDQIPELQEFVKGYILKSAEKDNKLLKKYESKIIEETLTILGKVKPYIEKGKIDTPELKEQIKNVCLLNEEKMFSSSGKMKAMFGAINRVLYITWDFDDGKHRDFMKQFGQVKEDGTIRWNIAEIVDEFDVEELRLKRIGLIKIWYYWDKIVFFYNLFTEYEKMTKEWFEKRRFMTLMGITIDEYDRLYKEFRQKEAAIDYKLTNLQQAEDNYYLTAKYLLELANRAYELFMSSEIEEKRQLLKLTLQNLKLKGKTVQYEAVKPFDKIFFYATRQEWLPRLDSNQEPYS